MSTVLPPFSCTYSPNIPELLQQLNCSVALSTYQAGKLIFLSAKDRDHLIQLPRNFSKAMGIALEGDKLGIATLDEVIVLSNSRELASTYPKNPNTYDSLFVPRSVYFTGSIDIHDLHWQDGRLWAVNTLFSCLCTIDHEYSFVPQWQPDFISELAPEDRCHLNGLEMVDGKPKFVTALGKTDSPKGWKKNKVSGGLLIDVETQDIIVENLPMPHSPRYIHGKLYVLFSATGELAEVDPQNHHYKIIRKFPGFVRGMAHIDDYLFIGLSKIRRTSESFADLPIAIEANASGVVVVHLPTGSLAGQIIYQNSVDEIYDVQILPGLLRPGMINYREELHKSALVTPSHTYWGSLPPI
jgi:uncharacterized protein (TIGR03032 family)